jgi:hypothetical protein
MRWIRSCGFRGRSPRVLVCSIAITFAALLLSPGGAAASGPQLLTFGEYLESTEISTQYEEQGILFDEEDGFYPEVRWDNSAYTNPVLSGTFGFGSTIDAQFVVPGTTTPATVENLSMDIGYINESGSTVLTVKRTSGPTTIFADEEGFNHLSLAANDITGFTVESVGDEPAGWTLDNLGYTIPAPPPPPPPPPPPQAAPLPVEAAPVGPHCPTYAIYDTRGSGEPLGQTSNPGRDFTDGLKARFASLHHTVALSVLDNPYPAVGVWSWSPIDPRQRLNGFGAFLHSSSIGAYKASEGKAESELKKLIAAQVGSPCTEEKGTKIILLGYSQGAEATGDVYGELGPRERHDIAAVVLWGDPEYNHADHPPRGGADRDFRELDGSLGTRGFFPEPEKVFSYCNEHDPICQWRLPAAVLAYYRLKEHDLYWKTDEAKNDGSAVASFLAGGGD